MTIPVDTGPIGHSSADLYTDFSGLTALKKSARANDPDALRQVAKQYESLFARMMIKSMRDAVGKDPMFGSDQEQSYQEMYDDQLSIELTKGKGLGLADMLVTQMQKLAGGGKTGTTNQAAAGALQSGAAQSTTGSNAAGLRMFKATGSSAHGTTAPAVSPPASSETQANFISDLWPAAQEAGQQLGVDPRNLIAQAALETDWGTKVPHDASGQSSNNLFGMKTGSHWTGASVTAATQEYLAENGAAVSTTGQFRAYDNRAQSFQDYVSLLRNSPRYAAALNTGSNVHAFATALQRGGYATDPDYASKVSSIAGSINPQLATLEPSLKSASARPINPMTGIL
jgi:peptidoglycan hydrolase FlgJ